MPLLAVGCTQFARSVISILLASVLAAVVSRKIVHPLQSILQTARLLGVSGRARNCHDQEQGSEFHKTCRLYYTRSGRFIPHAPLPLLLVWLC